MTTDKKTTRRKFLKGIGVAATGVAATAALHGCSDGECTCDESASGDGECDPLSDNETDSAQETDESDDGQLDTESVDSEQAEPEESADDDNDVDESDDDESADDESADDQTDDAQSSDEQADTEDNPYLDSGVGLPSSWDKQADIVVVGTGFAGLTAAVVARNEGAEVLILEKMSAEEEGGNSKISGNMWWTPQDVEEGISYITAMCNGLTDDESIRALAEEMSDLNGWLEGTFGIEPRNLGIFEPEYPELPGSDTVRTWNNASQTGLVGGAALWQPFRQEVDTLGIEVMYETAASELIQDPRTREIKGVKASSSGEEINIMARKAVVLACGGFEFDFEMQKQFLPGWPVYAQGSPGNTGDGIRMAQQAGAALWHMNNALAHVGGMIVPDFDPVPIPVSFPSNRYILVSNEGKRFMNEMRPDRHGFGHKEILFQFDGLTQSFPQLPCFGIVDENTRTSGAFAYTRSGFGWFGTYSGYQWSNNNESEIEKGWISTGQTLAELANALGIDADGLEQSVQTYNQACDDGVDSAFDRPANSLLALENPPYYGFPIYPIMYNTQGGPRRNGLCQIINPAGNPIPRLYSAGEMGSFWGWMYNGGGNNAECMCTGRIAARNAVKETAWG